MNNFEIKKIDKKWWNFRENFAGYGQVKLTAAGAVSSQAFTWSYTSGNTVATSSSIPVYTGITDKITLTIGSITLSGAGTYSGATALKPSFAMSLDPTRSYTLTVNFRQDGTAMSAAEAINYKRQMAGGVFERSGMGCYSLCYV